MGRQCFDAAAHGLGDALADALRKTRVVGLELQITAIDGDELRLYEAVTDFVSRKLAEIRGEGSRSTAGFALTTMQRRVASSTRAIRRTLERRLERLDKAVEDPEGYLRQRRDFQASLVDDGDDLDDLSADELRAVLTSFDDLVTTESVAVPESSNDLRELDAQQLRAVLRFLEG